MPFEPKLVHGDRSHPNEAVTLAASTSRQCCDDELALPDDLLELADQLGADAEHLASCYPSPDDREWSDPTSRRPNRFQWRMAAAAVVLLACGVWSVGELARQKTTGANPSGPSVPVIAGDRSASADVHSTDMIAMPLVPDARFSAPLDDDVVLDHIGLPAAGHAPDDGDMFGGGTTAECADLFQDLSAPAQEALLDLWEDESQNFGDLPL